MMIVIVGLEGAVGHVDKLGESLVAGFALEFLPILEEDPGGVFQDVVLVLEAVVVGGIDTHDVDALTEVLTQTFRQMFDVDCVMQAGVQEYYHRGNTLINTGFKCFHCILKDF